MRFDAVTLLLLVLAAGCSSASGAGARPSPSAGPYVATVVAETGTIHPTLQIAGVVTPYRQVGIAADLSEPIGNVYVQEGDHVRAGQPLANLITDDLEAQLASAQRTVAEDVARYAQAAYQVNATNAQDVVAIRSAQDTLHQAQVSLNGARTDLKRYEDLEAQGYLAAQVVDQQRTTVAADQAAVRTAQGTLDQAVANARANGRGNNAGVQQSELDSARATADAAQATVEQLRREIGRAAIVSPLDGIVDAVNANPGEYPSGRQLFTIEQMSSVYALLPTSTADVVQIRSGAPVTLLAAGATRKDQGKVAAVLDALQPGTTNFTVKVLVPNPDGHLHAGMPVTGTVALPAVTGIEIPIAAFIDDTHDGVYAVEADTVKTTTVREVKDDGTHAIVTGLSAGTRIVSNVDAVNVGNGDRVDTTPPTPGPAESRAPK
ncbi:MAG TPA: efflux RND transporter periplasmic adaptor subunit [Candidatus Lustribacter sp.]|nr:efflux RND transporter periplasmic adaptor subunit [Candidatus Lustribacter sp.]